MKIGIYETGRLINLKNEQKVAINFSCCGEVDIAKEFIDKFEEWLETQEKIEVSNEK